MLSSTELLLILAMVIIVCLIIGKKNQETVIVMSGGAGAGAVAGAAAAAAAAAGDDRYRRAPRPQRMWESEPEIPTRGALDPIPTRGAPESYQQMGIVESSDGKLLPLYGRRVAPRSDKFNYYTRTDTYNPVALPVRYKRKDCQDNAGCSEMSNGDSVEISPTGERGKITLYGFDGPRYSPEIA
jgi:hypothetical protein